MRTRRTPTVPVSSAGRCSATPLTECIERLTTASIRPERHRVVGDSDECILEIRFSGDDVANQLQKVEEDELETLVRMLLSMVSEVE